MIEIRSHCNVCQNNTRHIVVYTHEKNYSDENFIRQITYQLIECLGCESVKMKTLERSDDCERSASGEFIPLLNTYPPDIIRQKPKWLWHLTFPFRINGKTDNKKVTDFLNEIYLAMQNDSTRLAVLGIRALMETVMISKIGDQGTFKKNVDEFQKKGFLSQLQRDALDVVLEAGHATIHRAFKPEPYQVNAAIDIVENIIESIYVNDINQSRIDNVPRKSHNNGD